jgi:hypothetical protein
MVMAQALRALAREGYVNDIAAVVSGFLDGWLLQKDQAVLFLLKNIGIVIASFATNSIPPGIKHAAESSLGLAIAALLIRR